MARPPCVIAPHRASLPPSPPQSLAILLLHDGGVDVSADNINAVVAAANVTVAPYWGTLYAKNLAGFKIDDMLMKPGSGGGGGGGAAPAAAAGGAAGGKKEEKKEEKKEVRVGRVWGGGGVETHRLILRRVLRARILTPCTPNPTRVQEEEEEVVGGAGGLFGGDDDDW